MNVQTIRKQLNQDLSETSLNIPEIMPVLKFGKGIYALIEKGQDSSLLNDDEFFTEINEFDDAVGSYSNDTDDNFLEIYLSDHSIGFWSTILCEVLTEDDDAKRITDIVGDLIKAESLGYDYVRLV